MEPHQEGTSIGRPPFLTGENYSHWKVRMQSEKVWNAVEFASENSAKAMYSIFNVISTDEFRRITTCTSAKEAWDILQVTHEGTSAVKVSKLQMLTSRDLELRSPPLEESKDVESLKIDELVGSLQTFEMTLVSPRKAKEIALKAIKEESLSSESEDDEKMSEVELTKFAKNFKYNEIQKSQEIIK
ncbi:hypothetical protein CK203_060213 [Vitis vinifera]|uniref:DUF4219 domain-containing protein n=1 Tax=Vitis vinifera TaxID=29760 RepID=A0A438FS22_VITVI|nr:hypothetical protein CK203_060213 [Vitis vinifera]